MRVLVTGGRDFDDWLMMNKALIEYVNDPHLVIVHGAHWEGADKMVQRWAEHWQVKTERHPANWQKLGKKAGPLRNQEMVDAGADICVAFPTPRSRGTWDCVRRALDANITVRVIHPDGEERHTRD